MFSDRASSRYNSMTRMDGLFLCWIFADPRSLRSSSDLRDFVCFRMFPLLCRFSKCRMMMNDVHNSQHRSCMIMVISSWSFHAFTVGQNLSKTLMSLETAAGGTLQQGIKKPSLKTFGSPGPKLFPTCFKNDFLGIVFIFATDPRLLYQKKCNSPQSFPKTPWNSYSYRYTTTKPMICQDVFFMEKRFGKFRMEISIYLPRLAKFYFRTSAKSSLNLHAWRVVRIGCLEKATKFFQNEPRKKPSYFPLYWLVNGDPYNGLL